MSYNWDKGRMVGRIVFTNPATGETIDEYCHMSNRISTRIRYDYRPIHGLNRWNDAVTLLAPKFNFTIAFPAVSDSARLLQTLSSAGIPFIFIVEDYNNSGEYAPGDEKFEECRIEEVAKNVVVDQVPSVVFTGLALRYDGKYLDSLGTNMGYLNIHFGSGAALSNEQLGKLFEEWTNEVVV